MTQLWKKIGKYFIPAVHELAGILIFSDLGSAVATGSLTQSKTTDYVGNLIYENGTLMKILYDGGYYEPSTNRYYYFVNDYQGNMRTVLYGDYGNIREKGQYYPFGSMMAQETSYEDVQPYKFSGKEEDHERGLNLYDFHARQYESALGRFTSMDPMAERYYSVSPYAYCLGNPVKYVDPTGLAPIYDPDGNFLGTDDEGLQGDAIIMQPENFKQGMSPKEALKYNLGMSGLKDENAVNAFNQSYNGLKDRPDWDGYLTLEEANEWYRNGNGGSLFVDLNKIDLSGIVSLGDKYIGQEKIFNLLLFSGSINDGLVFGNIKLKRYPDHRVRAFSDTYDFEMHNWKSPLNWPRNLETIIGGKVAGNGEPYEINIYGSKKLNPILPWIK